MSPNNSLSPGVLLPEIPEGIRRIYLIRHGETDWNLAGRMQGSGYDIELNDRGKKQADETAQSLSTVPFDVIASSPLKRAKQTADTLHREHPEAERIVLEGFRSTHFGDFEGLPWKGPNCPKETLERFHACEEKMRLDKHLCWPGGGESTAQLEQRTLAELQYILKDYPLAKHIAIVSHGRPNGVLLASLVKKDATLCHDFRQNNCYMNVIDYDEESARANIVQ